MRVEFLLFKWIYQKWTSYRKRKMRIIDYRGEDILYERIYNRYLLVDLHNPDKRFMQEFSEADFLIVSRYVKFYFGSNCIYINSVNSTFIRAENVEVKFDYIRDRHDYYLSIYKCLDDYFIVSFSNSISVVQAFRCDTIDGVKQLIKDYSD